MFVGNDSQTNKTSRLVLTLKKKNITFQNMTRFLVVLELVPGCTYMARCVTAIEKFTNLQGVFPRGNKSFLAAEKYQFYFG